MVIPFDNEGRLLLIRTFRHETRSWQWQIPKGFGERSLTPEQCRELLSDDRLDDPITLTPRYLLVVSYTVMKPMYKQFQTGR